MPFSTHRSIHPLPRFVPPAALLALLCVLTVTTRPLWPGLGIKQNSGRWSQARPVQSGLGQPKAGARTAGASYHQLAKIRVKGYPLTKVAASQKQSAQAAGDLGQNHSLESEAFPYGSAALYGFAGGMAGFSVGLVTSIFTAASFGLLPNVSTADALFLFGAASSVLGMAWGGYYALTQKNLKASFVYTMLSAATGFGLAFGLGLAAQSNALFWATWPVFSLTGAMIGLRLTVQKDSYSQRNKLNLGQVQLEDSGETVVGLRFDYKFGINE